MNNWIETSGSPFVIVEQQYAHQWKGQENYNAICSVTDYLGKIYIDNHVLLVMGDEPMATRIVNKDGAILIIRWKYAPDYLTVEKLLENDIVTGAEPIEEVEVKWDSTELVLFDSLSPYCEASVKVFLSLQVARKKGRKPHMKSGRAASRAAHPGCSVVRPAIRSALPAVTPSVQPSVSPSPRPLPDPIRKSAMVSFILMLRSACHRPPR